MKKSIVSMMIVASMIAGVSGCADTNAPQTTAAPGESAASDTEATTEEETEAPEVDEPVPLVIDDWTEYIEQNYWETDELEQLIETPGDFISDVYYQGADVLTIEGDHEWIHKFSASSINAMPMFIPGSTIICTFASSVDGVADYGWVNYYPFDGGDFVYNEDGTVYCESLVWNDGDDSFLTTGDLADYVTDNGDGTYTIEFVDDHEELESGMYSFVFLSEPYISDDNTIATFYMIVGSPEAGEAPVETTAAEAESLGIGDTISEEFLEMTIDGAVVEQEIEPSNTSDGWYSYYSDQEDETYVVVYGTMKNLAGNDFELIGGTSIEFCFDDKYTYYGSIEVEENDGSGFDSWLKPLASRNYIIYASVPDELIDMYSSCTVNFQCSENIEWSSDYEYSYDIIFTNSEVD